MRQAIELINNVPKLILLAISTLFYFQKCRKSIFGGLSDSSTRPILGIIIKNQVFFYKSTPSFLDFFFPNLLDHLILHLNPYNIILKDPWKLTLFQENTYLSLFYVKLTMEMLSKS